MTYNLKDVILDELSGKAEYVDNPTYINRINVCEQCEHSISIIPIAGKTCEICGCFIKSKAKYRKSSCPIEKWLAIK